MTRLVEVLVTQQTSDSQIVGWRYVPFESSDPTAARVTIHRAYSETDEYVEIDTVPASQGWFQDSDVKLKDRWVVPFYKLALKDGAKIVWYGPVRVKGTYDKVSLGLIKQHNVYIKLAGVPVLIYPTLADGTRCKTCFDPVLNKPTMSQCPDCFGTGYYSGYAAPIYTLAVVGVESKSNELTTRVDQHSNVEIMVSNFPVLRPKDVIYVVDTGRRFSISMVAPVEKHLSLIHQAAGCVALKPDDIENNLPIPDLGTAVPVLFRPRAVHRYVSSTDGEVFNDSAHKISKI